MYNIIYNYQKRPQIIINWKIEIPETWNLYQYIYYSFGFISYILKIILSSTQIRLFIAFKITISILFNERKISLNGQIFLMLNCHQCECKNKSNFETLHWCWLQKCILKNIWVQCHRSHTLFKAIVSYNNIEMMLPMVHV